MRFAVILSLLCCLAVSVVKGSSNNYKRTIPFFSMLGSKWEQNLNSYRHTRSTGSSSPTGEGEEREPYLTLVEEMQNQTLLSGERASFKCKVESYPLVNLTYTWYKGNTKLVDDVNADPRIRIRNKSWGSKLQINDVYSSDSGMYRCEVSNTFRRVHTSAHLTVSFNLLPDDSGAAINLDLLKGKCQVYQGFVCGEFLDGDHVYLESFQEQPVMEQEITQALKIISGAPGISSNCQKYAKAAFCYYVFPPCATKNGEVVDEPKAVRLCREDCDLLKHDICRKEFFQQSSNEFISDIVNQADCSALPPTTSARSTCTSIGLPGVVKRQHKCYNDSGEAYRGTLSVTVNGETCQSWPPRMLYDHPQLSGGHNFCRNPGGARDAPWCYIDEEKIIKDSCQVPACNFKQGSNPDLVMILIPAVSVPILLGCFVLIFCVACKKKKEKKVKHTKGIKMEKKATLSPKRAKVPELSSNVVHVIGELGDGKFGKVFKAQILSNLHYCPNDPVAVKTLVEKATSVQVQDFQREMETFSALQHPNVACMKAVVVQPALKCMIFEYTNGVDLHEYLVMHSPQADFAKPPSSGASHASSVIDHADFVRIGIQVASGMEYLSSHNFIHRDLAARNVLVCGNMDLKICNLGVVRDSYLSSYYRSPQGGQMLPVRWMAPESLQSWQFSDKSAVWSFGVLLWEMFSYGLQPYCGYSNHEVLDMISRRQLLTCPDQCPAKMYSLINECWSSQPQLRPQFKDIHAKLVGWESTNTARMTSQLAQGIHRQLNNVMRDGSSGQFVQYNGPPHGTMIDGMNRPIPQQNYPNAPSPAFAPPGMQSQSPRMYQGGAASASSGHSGGGNNFQPQFQGGQGNQHLIPSSHPGMSYPQQHQKCPSYSSAASRSSGSVVSSDYNHHPPLRVNNLSSHPEVEEPPSASYPPPLPPQGYLHHPERNLHPPADQIYPENPSSHPPPPRMYVNIDEDAEFKVDNDPQNSRHSRPTSGMRSDGRMPLSLYQEPENSFKNSNQSPNRGRPSLSPKPAAYIGNHYNQNSADLNRSNERGIPESQDPGRDKIQDVVNGKAKSCDSGLPSDDFDSELTDSSHRPLLPGKQGHSLTRPTNKASPLIVPSACSSMSGSTQVTADTRVSS